MNKRPIEEAKDKDLRLSRAALIRAANEARKLAEMTGTDGFDHESDSARNTLALAGRVQEDAADYKDKS